MIEVLKQAYQLLLTEPHAPTVCNQLEVIFRRAIAELESQEPVGEVGWLADVPNTIREVCWKKGSPPIGTKLYTHPPQRTEPVDYEKLAALGWQAIECGICGGGAMGYPQRTEQEPVAWITLQKEAQQIVKSKVLWEKFIDGTPLANDIACWMADFALQHTHPPQRTWVGLTNEELTDLFYNTNLGQQSAVSQAVALLKEKNT